MKLFTRVECGTPPFKVSLHDRIMVLGSCFAENMAAKMTAGGFKVCANPFGPLYNPLAIASAIDMLRSGQPFGAQDCVEMGAGAGLICSFSHHTSFARANADDFLQNANNRLRDAVDFWSNSDTLIITFGTARVWRRKSDGKAVANCLKRPAKEFTHEMMSIEEAVSTMDAIASCGKKIIFTISPIRHLGEGAHDNTISKSTLHLAVERTMRRCPDIAYFPSYEILLDELRDYRFFAEDLTHPSSTATDIIWERFIESFMEDGAADSIKASEKESRRAAHRPIERK